MYNVSNRYLEVVKQNAREWDVYIDIRLRNGQSLRLTKSSLSLGTLTLKEGATCSDTIQVGSTFSNSFEFTILNSSGKYTYYDFYEAEVRPYVGLDLTGAEDFEYVPLGVFYILENVKKFSTIPIVCFDNMSRANKTFDFGHIVFPTTCSVIFREVINQCGFRVTEDLSAKIASLPYEINSLLTDGPTCRDVLAGFGVMLAENLRFNRAGFLESFWYDPVKVKTDRSTRVGNSSYGDNKITITGVYLEDAYGNTFSVGTEEYPVKLPISPIIQGSVMAEPILSMALERIQSVVHRPATVTFIGDPALQAGDILVHANTSVGDVTLPIMRLVYKLAGTETLESLGLSNSDQQQQSTETKQIRAIFNRAAQDRSELETAIKQSADTIRLEASETFVDKQSYANLSVQVGGVVSEVAQQTSELNAVKQNLTSVQQSSEQVSIQLQDIVDNGVSKVTTGTGYTFDVDGLRIKKSGEEMGNKLDNTGMYVTRSDETILQANNAGVVATDVTVRNYLIIGTHARFEDYTDGSDTKRTACFFI